MQRAAASVSALWSGTYKCTSAALDTDAWPGDALVLSAPSANLSAQVIIRSVKLTYTASCPDLVHYAISFANDWADDLAIKTSATVPADAWLPAPISPDYLSNLSGLAVTAMSNGQVTTTQEPRLPAEAGSKFAGVITASCLAQILTW
jgi:hypothetical protein